MSWSMASTRWVDLSTSCSEPQARSTAGPGLGDKLLVGELVHLGRANQVYAGLHQVVGAEVALGPHPVDDVLDAGQAYVPDPVGDEVDAPHQGAAVNPLGAGVPPFDAGRVQQGLAHVGRLHAQGHEAGLGSALEVAHQVHGADHNLRGALHLGEAGGLGLEEVRVEQHPQGLRHVVAGAYEGVADYVDGDGVPGRVVLPRRHLLLVGHEEVVQVAGDEPGRRRLPDDDVYDVVAVEVALVAEEGLLSIVVVLGLVLELPGEAAQGQARNLRRDGPAGEGPGALEHVLLGVVAHAHREELQELPAPVLVGLVLVVLVVVQPENHGRVLGQLDQQFPVVAHAVLAEHVYLLQHLVAVVHLGVAGGEDVVPEEGHLLLEGPGGVNHLPHVVGLAVVGHSAGQLGAGGVPEEEVLVVVGDVVLLGLQKLLHGGLVSPGGSLLQLGAGCSEAGAPHQVGHQRNVFSGSHSSSFPLVGRSFTLLF